MFVSYHALKQKTLISRIKQSRDDEPNYDDIAASLLKLNQTLRG